MPGVVLVMTERLAPNSLLSQLLALTYLLNQLLVPAVDPVKFSHCYCTVGKLWKLTIYFQVFHNLSCKTSSCSFPHSRSSTVQNHQNIFTG